MTLTLRPITKAHAYEIEHWFDHAEVQRRLGGRFWIHRAVRLLGGPPGEVFRGKTVLRSYGWVAYDADVPVAHVGGDVYDRWVRYHGEDVPVDGEIREVTMGLGYLVDPARWRRGYGRAAVEAVLAHPDLADVELFVCGIDADNVASRRCAESAGFHLTDPAPDFEGTLYYHRKALT